MADTDGRCVGCGFLGKIDRRVETSQRYPGTYEVEWLERGEPSRARHGVQRTANAYMPTRLVCYRGVLIADEIGDTDSNDQALAVLRKDRKCDLWCKYTPGLDPKDHFMERRIENLEHDRRAFESALNRHGMWIGIAALIITLGTMTADSMLYKLIVGASRWARAYYINLR